MLTFFNFLSGPLPEIKDLSTYGNNSDTSLIGNSENAPLVVVITRFDNQSFNT